MGENDAEAFADKAAELVLSAGERGCRQPGTLEAWYRFLGESCDCDAAAVAGNSALCQPPGGGAAGPIQHFAMAQPSTRLLDVARQFGDGATLASVCPKVLDETSPSYGYLPAIDALLRDVRPAFPAAVPGAAAAHRPGRRAGEGCAVVTTALASDCDCEGNGYARLEDSEVASAVQRQLRQDGLCDTADGLDCSNFCSCEIPQLTGSARDSCLEGLDAGDTPGYCYVNAARHEPNVGNPDLVADCPADSPRNLRFTSGAPPAGSQVLLVCE